MVRSPHCASFLIMYPAASKLVRYLSAMEDFRFAYWMMWDFKAGSGLARRTHSKIDWTISIVPRCPAVVPAIRRQCLSVLCLGVDKSPQTMIKRFANDI